MKNLCIPLNLKFEDVIWFDTLGVVKCRDKHTKETKISASSISIYALNLSFTLAKKGISFLFVITTPRLSSKNL